jgi:hypothetical protein
MKAFRTSSGRARSKKRPKRPGTRSTARKVRICAAPRKRARVTPRNKIPNSIKVEATKGWNRLPVGSGSATPAGSGERRKLNREVLPQ